jgi:hypothetical protein
MFDQVIATDKNLEQRRVQGRAERTEVAEKSLRPSREDRSGRTVEGDLSLLRAIQVCDLAAPRLIN